METEPSQGIPESFRFPFPAEAKNRRACCPDLLFPKSLGGETRHGMRPKLAIGPLE
jgi:hypothetical protein